MHKDINNYHASSDLLTISIHIYHFEDSFTDFIKGYLWIFPAYPPDTIYNLKWES